MFCPNCGKENDDGVNFCKYCGSKLISGSNASKNVPKAKKSLNKKMIIGIIVALAIVLLIVFFAGGNKSKAKKTINAFMEGIKEQDVKKVEKVLYRDTDMSISEYEESYNYNLLKGIEMLNNEYIEDPGEYIGIVLIKTLCQNIQWKIIDAEIQKNKASVEIEITNKNFDEIGEILDSEDFENDVQEIFKNSEEGKDFLKAYKDNDFDNIPMTALKNIVPKIVDTACNKANDSVNKISIELKKVENSYKIEANEKLIGPIIGFSL